MGKSEMSYEIDNIILNYLKSYKNYQIFTLLKTIQINSSTMCHKIKYEFQIQQIDFVLLYEYSEKRINMLIDGTFDTDNTSIKIKNHIEEFYKYFKNVNEGNLINIYEATDWTA